MQFPISLIFIENWQVWVCFPGFIVSQALSAGVASSFLWISSKTASLWVMDFGYI